MHTTVYCHTLITLSALLYISALLFSYSAWWCIFFFPLPLYYLTISYRLTFMHGFYWGILIFSCMIRTIITTYAPAFPSSLASVTPYILYSLYSCIFIVYLALPSGIWFWLMNTLIKHASLIHISAVSLDNKYSHKRSNAYPYLYTLCYILIWICTTMLYSIWIDQCCLWPFLRIEGNPFMHPLLALAARPQLLQPLSSVPLFPILTLFSISSKHILTLLLFTPAAALGSCFIIDTPTFKHRSSTRSHSVTTVLCIVICMWWIQLYTTPLPQTAPPHWLNHIQWLPLQGGGCASMAYCAQQRFKQILSIKPNTNLIILPESAFYTDALCAQQEYTQLWSAAHTAKPISIICGSFSRHKKQLFNTCYHIYNGTIMQQFQKTHTMPIIEQMPPWIDSHILRSVFFSALPPISPAFNIRIPFIINITPTQNSLHSFMYINSPISNNSLIPNNKITTHHTHSINSSPLSSDTLMLIPYICSELFFNQYPDDQFSLIPILALVNDSWTHSNAIQALMLRAAQVKAVLWQREILYISYSSAVYISKHGICHNFI